MNLKNFIILCHLFFQLTEHGDCSVLKGKKYMCNLIQNDLQTGFCSERKEVHVYLVLSTCLQKGKKYMFKKI